jgi:3-mercaptopyruvate sulfurtransferase SseA
MTRSLRSPLCIAGAVALASALLPGCSPKFSQEDVDKSGISLGEVRALVEAKDASSVLIADARGPNAYAAGHIPGAENFAINRFSGKHGETDRSLVEYKTIVVYADNPGSASSSALALRMMSTGYDNVRTFFEGFDAWKRAGLAVEKSGAPESPAKMTAPEQPAKPGAPAK